jgi:hypothetical protein
LGTTLEKSGRPEHGNLNDEGVAKSCIQPPRDNYRIGMVRIDHLWNVRTNAGGASAGSPSWKTV